MWAVLAIVAVVVAVARPTRVAGRRRRRSGLSVFGVSTGVLASTGKY